MIPFGKGWITIDRPVVDAARKFTSQLQELRFGFKLDDDFGGGDTFIESEVSCTLSPNPIQHIESLKSQSQYNSIGILSLPPLLEAIKADFPKWDGTSPRLLKIFQERNVDPRIRYEKFYSTTSADFFASYAWSGRSLFSISGRPIVKMLISAMYKLRHFDWCIFFPLRHFDEL
jgi:hypothetical protein